MPAKKHAIAIGLLTLDILGHPIDSLPENEGLALLSGIDIIPAGTAGGFALVAAKLGLNTGLIAAHGTDRMGQFVRTILQEAGVDTSLVQQNPNFPTSATILPIDSKGRRPTLHALGASMALEITQDAIDAAANTHFLHYGAIGAPMITPDSRNQLIQSARSAGAIISADLISPTPQTKAEITQLLPAIDWFLPSLTEAQFLTGHTEPTLAATALQTMGAKNIIIKLGAAGALLAQANDTEIIPAFNVKIIDTTSCGDAFCAGFITGLHHGWPPAQAARFAAATAALVAGALGTLGKLQNFEHTLAASQTLPIRSAP